MTTSDKNLLETALRDYNLACEELNRPAHDVMFNSVCHLSREAICSLLRMQLANTGITFDPDSDMTTLINLGRKHIPSLQKIEFESIVCGNQSLHDDSANYCINESRIQSCFNVMVTLKNQLTNDKDLNNNIL